MESASDWDRALASLQMCILKKKQNIFLSHKKNKLSSEYFSLIHNFIDFDIC